jgi:hypothetical protein
MKQRSAADRRTIRFAGMILISLLCGSALVQGGATPYKKPQYFN